MQVTDFPCRVDDNPLWRRRRNWLTLVQLLALCATSPSRKGAAGALSHRAGSLGCRGLPLSGAHRTPFWLTSKFRVWAPPEAKHITLKKFHSTREFVVFLSYPLGGRRPPWHGRNLAAW
jgi:hypothetical protein